MSNKEIIMIIFGMMLVTYIPRLLPALFLSKIKLNKKIEKFLKLIPYSAMSALIFPGILTVDHEKIYIGVIGGLVALILSWKKCPVIVCVIGAVATNLIIYLFV